MSKEEAPISPEITERTDGLVRGMLHLCLGEIQRELQVDLIRLMDQVKRSELARVRAERQNARLRRQIAEGQRKGRTGRR